MTLFGTKGEGRDPTLLWHPFQRRTGVSQQFLSSLLFFFGTLSFPAGLSQEAESGERQGFPIVDL